MASPLSNQVLDLITGADLDDADVAATTYPVRVRDRAVGVLAA